MPEDNLLRGIYEGMSKEALVETLLAMDTVLIDNATKQGKMLYMLEVANELLGRAVLPVEDVSESILLRKEIEGFVQAQENEIEGNV